MFLNRKQIQQLALMAGFEVNDIAGTKLDDEYQLFNGNLLNPENGETIHGIIACNSEYPDENMDILEP